MPLIDFINATKLRYFIGNLLSNKVNSGNSFKYTRIKQWYNCDIIFIPIANEGK